MGCDIHAVIEKKIEGKWVAVAIPAFSQRKQWNKGDSSYNFHIALTRNYQRFGALAGVREGGPAPRGVPDDVSDSAAALIAQWGVDGHSHSWLPIADAAKIFAETEYWHEWENREFAEAQPENYFFDVDPDQIADHRLVFWFDN